MNISLQILVIVCWITGLSATPGYAGKAARPASTDTIPQSVAWHYQVFAKPDRTFGYEIFSGAKKIIRQETVPSRQGNRGFNTRADAVKVAGLVVNKLRNNIFPPTITQDELRQLKVL